MKDIILATVLVLFLIFISNPMGIYMSHMTLGTVIVITTILFIVFAFTIFKYRPRDEREMQNEHLASKIGYIIGVFGLLAVFIVRKLAEGHADVLVATVLVLMILVETVTRWLRNKTV